jgi:hypothetical protein
MSAQQDDDKMFFWDWVKHEENILTNRGSFFLVGQSMLFAGVATLRSVKETSAHAALPVFYSLGVFIALIWISVNLGHHRRTRKPLQAKLNDCEMRHLAIPSGRDTQPWLKSNLWMGLLMPVGILISWVWLALV